MARYITLVRFAEQDARNIKESQTRDIAFQKS